MLRNSYRLFELEENGEVLQYLMADNSDEEDGLRLDQEDQQFIEDDIDAGISVTEINGPHNNSSDGGCETSDYPNSCTINSIKMPTFKWKKNTYTPYNFHLNERYNFGQINIMNDSQVKSAIKPIDIFHEVSNFEHLIQQIVIPESVRYAEQNGRVFTVDVAEMKAFMGMNYVMGYHVLPTFRSYWSTEPDMGVPYIAKIMPLSRFEEIRRNLHFCNNETQPNMNSPDYDRAYKIRLVMDHFNKCFQSAMNNTIEQAIDEHMIKFKGHNIMKQYIKNKPVKWGFKMWCRADSQSGYLFQFDLYTGRKNYGTELGLGESVVLNLSKCLDGLGCEVYFDNFFNSPMLQYNLAKRNIKACGTVRTNRKNLPKNMPLDKQMKRGDVFATSFEGISFIKWMDNRSVHLLTNFLSPIPKTTVKRRKPGSSEKINIACPEIITKYNKNMGGVDLMDQKKVCYELDRKAKIKYYLRLFFDLLDIAMSNSYIIYTKLHEEKQVEGTLLSSLEFRQLVARTLIGDFSSRKNSIPTSYNTVKRVSNMSKWSVPSHLMEKVGNRKRCVCCARKHIENRTNNTCTTCKVHLCFTTERNCFAEYHC